MVGLSVQLKFSSMTSRVRNELARVRQTTLAGRKWIRNKKYNDNNHTTEEKIDILKVVSQLICLNGFILFFKLSTNQAMYIYVEPVDGHG